MCPPQPPELAERLYKVLCRVFSIVGRRDPYNIPAGDLTLAQLSILVTVRDRGPMRMNALAAHERVRNPTTTVAIRRLEKLGFVARSTDPADLRGVLVTITDQGNARCDTALTARRALLAAMLKTLSPKDRLALKDAMPQLERLASQGTVGRGR